MADSKVSELSKLTNPTSRDLLYIIDVPVSNSSTKVGKNIDLKTFFGNVNSNTTITDNFKVSGNTAVVKEFTANTLVLNDQFTPANSTLTTGFSNNQVWSDATYLYRRVGNKIQRIPWQDF